MTLMTKTQKRLYLQVGKMYPSSELPRALMLVERFSSPLVTL